MDKTLYFITNVGCDDTTYGIVELTDEELNNLKLLITDLNKNSTYGCKPKIYVYKIDWSNLKEVNLGLPNIDDYCDDNYVDEHDRFYYKDKVYTWAEQYFNYFWDAERVI